MYHLFHDTKVLRDQADRGQVCLCLRVQFMSVGAHVYLYMWKPQVNPRLFLFFSLVFTVYMHL